MENRKRRCFEGKVSIMEKDLLSINGVMILNTRNKKERQLNRPTLGA